MSEYLGGREERRFPLARGPPITLALKSDREQFELTEAIFLSSSNALSESGWDFKTVISCTSPAEAILIAALYFECSSVGVSSRARGLTRLERRGEMKEFEGMGNGEHDC